MSRQVSHSEITTYLDCQKKWDLIYNKGLKVDNIHLQFGSMGHEVLETRIIPDESLYPELKEAFCINSWENYFTTIFNELDETFKDYEVLHREYRVENEYLKGVIDVVWKNKITGKVLITDYKFSTKNKGFEDIYLDEQMIIYAVLYSLQNNINVSDIEIGYINIPKTEFKKPRLLKNGTLSKDKAQCTTRLLYLEAIKEFGLNINDYEDILSELNDKKMTNTVLSSINNDMMCRIMKNIDNVIEDMSNKTYVLEKCSYQCKYCEFVEYCKHDKVIK
jgi:CRISPR/Cas system-associated exonuclease Cas4 (RecB family)